MKVIHINTFLKGGAYQAANRLQNGLLEIGIDSNLIGFSGIPPNKNTYSYPKWKALYLKIVKKLKLPINQEGKNVKLLPVEGTYENYSFPTSSIDLSRHPLVEQADIIHLHWVNNFLDYPSFFKKVNKPIVWTLHDMNLFQGGFHYLVDQQQNHIFFERLDEKLIKIKKSSISRVKNLQIVCPSKWLMSMSRNSQMCGKVPHDHIFNCLDLNVFKPLPKKSLRLKYNIPNNKLVFLFIADNIENHRKGFDIIINAIQSFGHRKDFVFCVLGELNTNLKDNIITQFGFISDLNELAEIYNIADAVILPSREDNLPNVMLESISCGTPVIAFPIGGIPEVVINGLTGILAREVSSVSLKEAIFTFANREILFNQDDIRSFAEKHFDQKTQASKYLKIYQRALEIY